nr:hypothetical protein [Tanacetum cinerariifolium]
ASKVPVVDYHIVLIDNKPRYPLLRFTLEQLVNVARLQVEEESEMSFELLSESSYLHLMYQAVLELCLVKRSGDVTRLQALVDKKKIVISEAVIREILQLNDAEGVNQVGDLSTHTTQFISPALTQKVFANMRRVGKGFSRVETPLFEGMIAERQPAEEELGAEQVQVDAAVAAAVVEDVAKDVIHMDTPSPPPHGILSPPQEPSSPPHQPPCLENDKAAQQLEIVKLKARVKKLEKINMVKSSKLGRLKKVGTSQRVESSDDMENVFNQGRIIVDMDQDEGIELVDDQEKDAEVKGRHADKQAELYNLNQDHSSKVLNIQEDDTEVQEAVEIVTTAKLMTEVVTATATATQVVAANPEDELPSDTPAETPKVKDKGKGIYFEALKPMKKKDQIEMDAEYARKLQEEINKEHEESYKNIDWNAALDHVQSKEP